MEITLTQQEMDRLLESLEYSLRAVREAQGTPYAVRQENLAFLDHLKAKLREAKREGK